MPIILRPLLSLLTVLILLAGCASKPPVVSESETKLMPVLSNPQLPPLPAGAVRVNGIAAIVNDDVITFRQVLREAQPVLLDAQKRGLVDDKARREIRLKVRDNLIEKLLTDQKVKELGIRIGDEEIRQAVEDIKRQNNNMTQSQLEEALKAQGFTMAQYEAQIREQLERLRLVSMEVRAKVLVTDKDAEEYYRSHQDKYAEEEQFRARHIFIRVDEKGSAEEIRQAMQKALSVLFEARQGKDFVALAKEYSDDPAAKADGGDLGTFRRGEMLADLEKALLPLKPGAVGELVSTPSGLHIVKLEERITGAYKPFESVKADIIELLYRQKQDERFATWLKELRSKASIILKDGSGII